MAPHAQIHGYAISTWTRTARMTCIEKGIGYELIGVARGGEQHERLHPFLRMPIVEIDGLTLTETLAITAYLDQAVPDRPLQPAELGARLRMLRWMSIAADYGFREVVRTVPRDRPITDEEARAASVTLRRVDALIDDVPFLVGEMLTLADLYLAPQIANCCEKAPQLLDGLHAVNAWARTLSARPSFQQTSY